MGEQYLMPEDLKESILFTENELVRLGKRAIELNDDKTMYIEKLEKLRKKKSKRDKQIDHLNSIHADYIRKFKEENILKFGDVIDLKILDSL